MKHFNQTLLFLFVILFLSLSLLMMPSVAQNNSNVGYSASNCIPPSNGSWGNVSGSLDGLYWHAQGGVFANNAQNPSKLYCPVPYNYKSKEMVSIIVSISDGHDATQVNASLYGRGLVAGFGAIMIESKGTGMSDVGHIDLPISVFPHKYASDIRYLWLEVEVPRKSFLIGYTVEQQY